MTLCDVKIISKGGISDAKIGRKNGNPTKDENLALVMSYFVDNSYGIIANDIYKVSQINFDSTLLEKIKVRLDKYGFEEWKMQD